jgi:hypothetical protein
VADPLVREFWPQAVARSKEVNNIGACLSQARHGWEARWGLQTLEIPQSAVCDLPTMRWFIVHLLAHLPRFWETYNSALLEYRRIHKVRSAAHPVPELEAVDGWLEAPLWIWSDDDPRRRGLFVRMQGDELILSDWQKIEFSLSITPEGDAATAVEQLAVKLCCGIKLRTRALITTLAARLLLGDLFIHGIGGAKYDELTDRIIQRFFGVDPPGYMAVSGTLHLPLGSGNGISYRDQLRQANDQLRQLQFHPEAALAAAGNGSATADVAELIAEKQRWVETAPTVETARSRCRSIRQVNEALQPAVARLRESWTTKAAELAIRQRGQAIVTSREYAFTLFPESALTKFLLPILENSAQSG